MISCSSRSRNLERTQIAQHKIVILNGLTSDDASVNTLGLLVIVTLIVDRERVITFLNSLATLGLATLYTNTFCCSFKCWFDAERKEKIYKTLETFSTGSLESLFFKTRVSKTNSKFIHWETLCWLELMLEVIKISLKNTKSFRKYF